jgi:uncharacterized membrane protein YccF (DUF307 family)
MRRGRVQARLAPMRPVNALLNVIWVILAGFWLAVGYLIAGIVMFILILTIPFGVQALKLAGFAFWPFGRHVERKPTAGAGSAIGNVIWFLLAGWWLALAHLVTGVLLFITIIGIPLAIANFKLIPMALVPFGREVVPNRDIAAPGPQPQPY